MASSFSFVLNGQNVEVSGESTQTTLLQWLRQTGRTGTKEGCAEGDCGACTVLLSELDVQGQVTLRAINSCITLLPMLAGREVVTVEGLSDASGLHPVQSQMVACYGSQCGYCTPGFVMSMAEAFHRSDLSSDPKTQMRQVGDQLNGNLCRCTGYRPIRDAMMHALTEKSAYEQSRPSAPPLVALRKKPKDAEALAYEFAGANFSRPTSLTDLLAAKAHNPAAELVCGATEIGVYINKKNAKYNQLISTEGVSALRAISEDAAGMHIGGAASLTDLEDALRARIPLIDKMLWVFASRQIRSRASLAGNLVTASPIGDMAPCLLALDAQVVLSRWVASASRIETRSVPISNFFAGYRKSVIVADEVLTEVLLPKTVLNAASGSRVWDSFKVSKRREMDIAIVSAAFRVECDAAGVVVLARLAYGGVAATPMRALEIETLLLGKPWNAATAASVEAKLAEVFTPLDDVRSGKAYRVGLIVSLWRKFALGVQSEAQDLQLTWEDAERAGRVFAPPSDASRALSHESGALHVTGAARYVDDDAAKRSMLQVWPVRSKVARGKITKLDVRAAEIAPGIACVLTAKDIPGLNDVGAVRKDEPLLAADAVAFAGQWIAVVVGDSIQACKDAAALVVLEITEEPPILGLLQAISENSYHTDPHVIVRGDARAAIDSAPHKLSGRLEVGGQEHFYLEAQAAWAEYEEDGNIVVSSSTQHPSEIQAVVSHVMHLPRNQIIVQSPRMGGGFGGKETQGNAFAALAALASKKTGKPVAMQLDRDVDMESTGKRHPFHFAYEVGFDSEGMLLGAIVRVTNDGGYALDLSESICDRALFHLDNAYYIPAARFEGRVAKTNTVSHTAFRGFGGPQGMVAIEEIIDAVARTTGLAPADVRAKNFYRGEGASNTTHYGQELAHNRMPRIWSELLEKSNYRARQLALAKHNQGSPHIKRGIAITPVKFGISFTATFLNQAGALVHIYQDGTVQVNHGGTEMGQGLYTKMRGVAMRELGVSQQVVRVMKTQTDKVPNTSATAASAGADLNGQAVKLACEELCARLTGVAKALWQERFGKACEALVFADDQVADAADATCKIAFAELVQRAYFAQVGLSATGFYRTPGIGYDKKAGKGKPFFYFAYGAAVSEVEVDSLSGMKRVCRVDIVHDVGESLNHSIDIGQIEGAFVQGMGWLTGEELKWNKTGQLLSHSASTYQIPSFGDAPADFRVSLLQDAAQPGVIHGSKAVGEPPLMLAISVREAIRDAVAQFAPEPPKRAVSLQCPATHEAIFAAITQQRGA
jgi:xanthine dehydrogenase molybdopterin binding subunit/xanthine dehydrogenase small subunit